MLLCLCTCVSWGGYVFHPPTCSLTCSLTHSLSHSLTYLLTHLLNQPPSLTRLTLSLSLSHSLAHPSTLTCSLAHSLSHSLTLSLIHSLTLTRSVTHPHTHTRTHPHTPTHLLKSDFGCPHLLCIGCFPGWLACLLARLATNFYLLNLQDEPLNHHRWIADAARHSDYEVHDVGTVQ